MTTDDSHSSAAGEAATRERVLADTFVMLADTLVDDYDVVDFLHGLANCCVSLLGAAAAGLLLMDPRGQLAVVGSSSEQTRLLEVYQLQNDEGPCMDCVRTRTAVVSGELSGEAHRWPRFVPAALAVGFHSVVAVPMRLRDEIVGGLNLFYADSPPLSTVNQDLAQAMADVATIGILQQRATHRGMVLVEQLQHALNSRVAIEQAKGVLAERYNMDMDAAYQSIRRHSRNNNQKLTDVAVAIVRGDISPDAP